MRCWTSESLLKHVAHTHRCSSESWGSCSSWQPPAMTSKRWLPITVDPCRCCRGCSGIPSITEYNGRARISCAALRLRRGYDTSSPMQVSSTCVCVCVRARGTRVHTCMLVFQYDTSSVYACRRHRGNPARVALSLREARQPATTSLRSSSSFGGVAVQPVGAC